MPAFRSPHAPQGTTPAKIVTIIKLQAPSSWATAGWENEAIYSSPYVQQVYDYFNYPVMIFWIATRFALAITVIVDSIFFFCLFI